MTYIQVLNKCHKVLASCENTEQLVIGKRYCRLLLDTFSDNNIDRAKLKKIPTDILLTFGILIKGDK